MELCGGENPLRLSHMNDALLEELQRLPAPLGDSWGVTNLGVSLNREGTHALT